MTRSQVDAVVIGAGAAGIAAARRLREAGRDVLLIEARDRLGGRGFTRIDDLGGPLDLGCGWLHSGDANPWTDIAAAQGRAIDRSPPPWEKPAIEAGFPAAAQAAFREAIAAFRDRVAREASIGDDRPVSDFLAPGGRWNALISAVSTYVSGAEPETISARDLARYDDTGVNWRVVDGLGAAIAAHGAELEVALGAPVTRIDHSGRRIRIETPRGTIEAAQAVVTIPSALIADGAIAFTPELPAKREAAAGLPLGLADKLYFVLDGAEEFEPDSRAVGRPDRTATAIYHFRPLGRPLVEAYFGGDCAAGLEREGEGGFVDFASRELVGLFGAGIAKRLTPLSTHLWRSDPFARGSYSYALPGRAGDRAILAEPVEGRLFFAGEACSERDYSTAHGAYRTGLAAADAALAASR